MAALTLSSPSASGGTVTSTAATVGGETLTQSQLGAQGVNLRIQTTGTASNVTVSDGGFTPASNPGTPAAVVMGATAVKVVYISPSQVNLGTGLVTITSTSQTGLSYEAYPA